MQRSLATLLILMSSTLGAQGRQSVPNSAGSQLTSALQTQEKKNDSQSAEIVSLNVQDSTIGYVIRTLGQQAGRPVSYNAADPLFAKRINVRVANLHIMQALSFALQGTGLIVALADDRETIVVRNTTSTRAAQVSQGTGSVSGQVLDSATRKGISGVTVVLADKKISVVTSESGQFIFRNIAAGSYTIEVKSFGYKSATVRVSVATDKNQPVTVMLTPTATSLNEVVTTAVGQQRKIEVANDIVKINVDEVAARSPVRSVADVLEASQVPGVQVQRGGGDPGSPTKIRIRGVSSISQSNDPVVIVDGIWIDAAASKPSKLDDIDPSTIENIEIVRGPSAATLYGQDASNGVIVITTKRGRPGASRWNASYNRDWGQTYGTLPLSYYGSGYHPTTRQRLACGVLEVLKYDCIQDGVAVFDPNDPLFAREGAETNNKYSIQVDGGTSSVTYSISGSTTNTIGVRRVSPVEMARFRRVGYLRREEFRQPSQLDKRNFTSRLDLQPRELLTIGLTGVTSHSRLKDNRYDTNWGVVRGNIATKTSAEYYNTDTLLDPNVDHRIRAIEEPVQTSNNIIGGVLKYGPFNASRLKSIVISSNLGAERGSTESSKYTALTFCGTTYSCFDSLGERSEKSVNKEMYTARVSGSSNFSLGKLERFLEIRPSIGGDLRKTNTRTVEINKVKIPPGDRSINAGELAGTGTRHILYENATAGWYLNSTIGILRRVYFDLGIRQDIGSAITSSSNAKYPKIGGSWLVSDESFWRENNLVNLFRIRSAFGHSAVQPDLGDIYGKYRANRTVVDGKIVRSVEIQGTGNSLLQPERATEIEVGFDADVIYNRLNIIVTYANSMNRNVLVPRHIPPSIGAGLSSSRKENVARVINRSMEVSATGRVIENRNTLFILNYSLTLSENKIKKLGGNLATASGDDYVDGYPLNGVWQQALLGYKDDNGDGILSRNEVVLSDQPVYIGTSQPRYRAAYGGSVTLYNQITLDSRFSYQSQYIQSLDGRQYRYGSQDITSPLEEQAAEILGFKRGDRSVSDLRWNSASIQYHLPAEWLRPLRARSVSISIQGQNLMLWSNYLGRDPGVNSKILSSEGRTDDGFTPPSPRLYVLDFKVGF